LFSMHLFKNQLLFDLICEFSNNFLYESPVHYNILVHKSWKLHQIFKFVFWNFDIYSISIYFLKLYKEDVTTTPIASYRIFVIVNKAPFPQFHQKSSNDIQNQHILYFLYFIYIFTYVFLFLIVLMRIGFQWCVSTYKKC
jgi:small-conductance mechanosensitive channel